MRVKELIEQLNGFNPNATISLLDSESIYLSFICVDNATPLTTGHVFIEGCDYCESCEFGDDGFCLTYNKCCSDVDECYQYTSREC